MKRVTPIVKKPLTCTDAEAKAFCCLVMEGGQVLARGLEGRVRSAMALVFLYDGGVGDLAAVAAVKHPHSRYRESVFRNAGAVQLASGFPLELGWVFVRPEHRRKHYSRMVCAAAVQSIRPKGRPVFATTRADNVAMHRTLGHLGFSRHGQPWDSKRPQEELVLFVQDISQQAVAPDGRSA